jgi:branched-chain amino acid transport system permease protein
MSEKSSFSTLFQHYSPLIFLIAPLFLVTVLADILGNSLFERIVTVLFINLILVLGLQIFMGNSGILSFAHIGFMGIGAYASVLFSMTPQAKAIALPQLYPFLSQIHLPFWPSVFIGAAFAALIAAIISYPLMRLSDAAAVITTFALLVIIHVVLVHWDRVTNGPRTLFGIDLYTTLWVSALCGLATIVIAYVFKESNLGLKLRASRDDRFAASTIGVNIVNVRWEAFTLSAFVAGFGGGLWAHYITSFSPSAFYLTETFVILAMLVVGGPNSVSGAVAGTVLVTIVREGLRAVENGVNISQLLPEALVGFTEVMLAIALILILIFRPAGILGGRELRWGRKRYTPKLDEKPAAREVREKTSGLAD